MRRKAFTLFELLVIIAVIAILAMFLFPTSRGHGENPREEPCQSNPKQIGWAFLQYAQDHGDRFPPVTVTRSGNWVGSIQPYLKMWWLFQCPSGGSEKNKTTDYFFNANLEEIPQEQLEQAKSTILGGEGINNSPTNYALR